MKKHVLSLFIIVCWFAVELFQPLGPETGAFLAVIPAVGFAAAFLILLFVKNKPVSYCLAAAVCIGVCVYDIGFLRMLPPLVLLAAHAAACVSAPRKKEKNDSRRDVVYTVLLLTGLLSLGLLIHDIYSCVRLGNAFAPERPYWLFVGIVAYFAALLLTAYKTKNKNRLVYTVYVCGGVCALCCAAGFALTSAGTVFPRTVFPWLCFLSAAAAADDGVTASLTAAAERVLQTEE